MVLSTIRQASLYMNCLVKFSCPHHEMGVGYMEFTLSICVCVCLYVFSFVPLCVTESWPAHKFIPHGRILK